MFSAPSFDSPNLNLIQPNDELGSAMSYSSPSFTAGTPSPTVDSSPSAGIYASMGLSAFSAILNTFSQVNAIKAQGVIQEGIARTNAKIATYQAEQSIEAGNEAASRIDSKTRQTSGAIRAAQGGSGIDVASGSSALVRAGVEGSGAIDALTIKNNATRRAWGYQTEAIQDSYQGQIVKFSTAIKSQESILSGGLQAINGPLAIGSRYLRMSRYARNGVVDDGAPFQL